MKLIKYVRWVARCLFAFMLSTAGAGAADEAVNSLQGRLKTLYPGTQFTDVAASELAGIFEVVLGRNVAYTDSDGRYFLFGHLFDMSAQLDLTAQRKDRLQRVDFSELPLGDAIKTVHGGGSRVFAVFSDPDCPYCKRLEPELAKIDDATIYTFLMPLVQLHENARENAINVWCAADRVHAWSQFMLHNETPKSRSCDHPVDRNVSLGERLQINGTPTLIAADGRIMPGAASAAQIEAWLANSRMSEPGAGSGAMDRP